MSDRYPEWLRRALYRSALEANIWPPAGVYRRPAISPSPFYTQFGTEFVWDVPYSAYAVARVGGDLDLARGFVENLLELAEQDGPDAGMVPRHVHVEGHMAGQSGSQCPLLAWLARELHRMDPDEGFVARVYPALAAFVDWWQSPRRDADGDGLSEYAGTTPTFVAYESGHDFSPERDLVMAQPGQVGPDGLVHEPIADVFLNSCLYAELDAVSELARVVDDARADEFAERRDALGARMRERMWDDELGGFFPVVRSDLCASQPRHHRHTAALLQPLWAGLATEEEGRRTLDLVIGRTPPSYPHYDATMSIRLGSDLYLGYQIATESLRPSRGAGDVAGGLQLTPTGFIARFDEHSGPGVAAFRRLVAEVDVATAAPDASLILAVTDGDGAQHTPVAVPVAAPGTIEGTVGRDPYAGVGGGTTWTRGLRRLELHAPGCEVSEVRLRYSRMDRSGLLSAYGIKSAHPLDGKHPAPGAPTDFWSGTIWGPHQFHGVPALARYGEPELALAVARAFCDSIAAAYGSGGSAFEHNSHENGRGLGVTDYTWGAGTALVLLAEHLDPVS